MLNTRGAFHLIRPSINSMTSSTQRGCLTCAGRQALIEGHASFALFQKL